MAMSDCVKCWDTPCRCGYEYINYSKEQLIEMKDMFQRLIDDKDNKLKGLQNETINK